MQGRLIGSQEVAQVRELLAAQPKWSRWRLSQELARKWEWRSATGQLKDMAARTLLLKMEARGWIVLPARKRASPNRMRHKRVPALDRSISQEPLETPQNLQYLVRERSGRPVACLLFGAAAWQCADRDRHVGWDATTRAARLHLITNNTRFLIVPWVDSPCLASHVLGLVLRRIRGDWQRKYGHPIYLLETFVERDRFAGTCYQATNWLRVGQTKGRTRQDAADGQRHQVPIKDIYLLPLHRRFAQRLQEPSPLQTGSS